MALSSEYRLWKRYARRESEVYLLHEKYLCLYSSQFFRSQTSKSITGWIKIWNFIWNLFKKNAYKLQYIVQFVYFINCMSAEKWLKKSVYVYVPAHLGFLNL
jgi:hypothetical protein